MHGVSDTANLCEERSTCSRGDISMSNDTLNTCSRLANSRVIRKIPRRVMSTCVIRTYWKHKCWTFDWKSGLAGFSAPRVCGKSTELFKIQSGVRIMWPSWVWCLVSFACYVSGVVILSAFADPVGDCVDRSTPEWVSIFTDNEASKFGTCQISTNLTHSGSKWLSQG